MMAALGIAESSSNKDPPGLPLSRPMFKLKILSMKILKQLDLLHSLAANSARSSARCVTENWGYWRIQTLKYVKAVIIKYNRIPP